MSDSVEKSIELKAPVSRVWRALTDYREFGQWFRVNITEPFAVDKEMRGHITYPGYEHIQFLARVTTIEPEHTFAVDPKIDYTREPRTLVTFTLTPTKDGTRLVVTETGFEKIPAGRRAEAFRMNEGGWVSQMENIRKYVEQKT